MLERLAVTDRPLLIGFAPGTTLTVSSVVSPACAAFGVAVPVPVGFVADGTTVTAIDAVPCRPCASLMAALKVFEPVATPTGTVTRNENVLSPPVHRRASRRRRTTG